MKAESSMNPSNLPARLPHGVSNNLRSYSPTQLHFLMLLSHLQRLRRDTTNVLDAGDWRMRLIHKSLYSVYSDCVELGMGDEAKLLMAPQPTERS